MIHSFPAPIIVHAFNPRFNRGIRGIRDARAGVHLEEEGGRGTRTRSRGRANTYAQVSRTPLEPAVHTGACLYVTHASSVHVAPRYLRDD